MIRAAVAGLGWWGQHMVRRLKGSEHLRIVTAVETNPQRAGFAAEHGLEVRRRPGRGADAIPASMR